MQTPGLIASATARLAAYFRATAPASAIDERTASPSNAATSVSTVGDAVRVTPSGRGPADRLAGDLLEHCPDPLLILDADGIVICANSTASILALHVGAAVMINENVGVLLSKLHIVNAGNPQPWLPAPGESSPEELISLLDRFGEGPIFQLVTTARKRGWIVQLANVTPLAIALKSEAEASRHRASLLDLLSHDMRTPLVAIITTMAHPDVKNLPDNLKQVIDRAARRALLMVDSVVRLIRAESAKYVFAPIDLHHILEEAVDLVWQTGKAANVNINLHPSNVEFVVMLDRGVIIQVFTSLLNTMINQGGGGRSISCALGVSTLHGKPAVSCSLVEDPAERSAEHDRTFTTLASFSGDSTGTISDSHSLPFAKTVVARHQGTMVCESLGGVLRAIVITVPTVEP